MLAQRVTVVCAVVLVAVSAVAFGASLPVTVTDRSARAEQHTLPPIRVVALPEQVQTALPRAFGEFKAQAATGSRGAAGAPPGSTRVFGNEITPVVNCYTPGANQRMADDLRLADGACNAVYYNLGVYGSGPANSTFDVHTELWNGDPCMPGSTPIAGSASDFNSLPNQEAYLLEVTIVPATPIPATAWLAATFSTANAGWLLAGQAEVGSTQDFFSENDTDANPDVCALFHFAGLFPPWAGFWANVYCDLSVTPAGSCCDGTTGQCVDGLLPEECVGEQRDWLHGVSCVDRDPGCRQHTGACCDLVAGVCADDVLESACMASQESWTKGATCADIVCEAVTGACCNHDPFGGCTDGVTSAGCDCAECEWTKLGQCADIECARSAIPTVGGWGLAILLLILLVGAKIRFGRALAANV
ncbi:MAG: hypothetical protein V1790_17135 [Planctomycetota bacterium]